MIHKIDYYHIEIPDNPGAAFWVLLGLKKAGGQLVNSFTASPEGYLCHGRVRIALNPHRRHT